MPYDKKVFRPTMGIPTPAAMRRSVAATKRERDEMLRLRERARVDAAVPGARSGGRSRKPVVPAQPIQGETATRAIGFGSLIDALAPKPKKKGRR